MKRLLSMSLLLVAAWSLPACGSSKKTATAAPAGSSNAGSSTASSSAPGGVPNVAPDPAVEKLVPDAIRGKGSLTVATDASYAPNEFIGPDGHTVIGMDADLTTALGRVMGLKVNLVNETFAGIIPGLQSHKYDVGASSFTDTKKREQVVDFVDYFQAGISFYTKATGGTSVTGLADLCGKSVGVERGTIEETDDTAQSAKCKKAGKPGVSVQSFPDQNGANVALLSGRVQVVSADSPVTAYAVKRSNGQFTLTGQTYGTAPYGLAFPKAPGLARAAQAGLKVLIKDGAYSAILAKWGLQSGAIPSGAVKINGATS